ncbi:HupE/UreJ family protein [Sphingobacteriaceae bacterium WQ 2009]|uniref:HupE/UreJ family protein n=1 Tax=Rhinopithecimicrobium faecis TaxID=2820698 RepID=A0A8T4HE94_9SPHI|nr:HupE/UreJ family protein [Sphingobacteriaceae bacterium WQ 2009]
MEEFSIYLQLGLEHILDVRGYDHILFVLVLCCRYVWKDWRNILLLVTAFTLGHSITLALAALKMVQVNSGLIEFLIPVTILLTALTNIFKREERVAKNRKSGKIGDLALFMLTLIFGLIHGLGFSNYLQSLLGKEQNLWKPLLAFNIGLELGQLVIVLLVTILSTLLVRGLQVKQRDWIFFISSAVFGIAFIMALERI